jgi:tRNA pseudouridine38-40 synthase
VRNIKIILEYDGCDFVGWQRQPKGRSVQGEIENALSRLHQEEISVTGGGRTDSGVHARGQTANYRCDSGMDLHRIMRGLSALLPEDISLIALTEMPIDFHARYSAKARTYSYSITTVPSALLREYSWYVKYHLDIDLLDKCAQIFLGIHDFKIFCKDDTAVKNFICDIKQSFWTSNQTLYRYQIQANRFLHGMVRFLVGTMVDVSRGYISLAYVESIFMNNKIEESEQAIIRLGQVAPAQGLVLESIDY